MTNLRNGTTMMSGAGILTNGKGTRREYGQFNLDELAEGDRIGMMRKANGNLHYFINGLDQGVAASRVPLQVWGVVDLYGMTVKVTIVDRDERDEQNLITRRNLALRTQEPLELAGLGTVAASADRLLFHPACGSHAAVINGGAACHRPNAADDFNFGVVLTNRPLKTNEVFEVRLDKMVTKWAGSIEIGVTTHAPNDLEFPSTMTNIRSGTWMMTGNGVMHNGTTTVDDYGQNLDKLKVKCCGFGREAQIFNRKCPDPVSFLCFYGCAVRMNQWLSGDPYQNSFCRFNFATIIRYTIFCQKNMKKDFK